MKKLLLTIAALLVACATHAATLSASLTATSLLDGRTNSAVTLPSVLYSITVVNGTSSAATIALFDSATTNQTYTTSTYTNYVSYSTNYSAYYTNANSVITTNTYSGLYTLENVVTGATLALPKPVFLAVPASGSVTYTPEQPVFFNRGILVTNSHAMTYSMTYSTVR